MRIRRQPISETELKSFDTTDKSPLWKAFEPAFEAMFEDPRMELAGESQVNEEAICLYSYDDEPEDWSWYVTVRYENDTETDPHIAEEKLYTRLFESGGNTMLYFHGHIGVGKSTMVNYLFRHYIPNIKKWPSERLRKLVPIQIPLSFETSRSLEEEWDSRVESFLYERFTELTSKQFAINLATYISFPKYMKLFMGENGDLRPTKYEDDQHEFVENTMTHIHDTYRGIDRASIQSWIKEDICRGIDLTIGRFFNCNVIKLLAEFYGYEFILIVDNIDQEPKPMQDKICRLVHHKADSYRFFKNVRFLIATRENFLEPIFRETFLVSYNAQRKMLYLPPLPFRRVLEQRKRAFFNPQKSNCVGEIELAPNVMFKEPNVDNFLRNLFLQFDNIRQLTDLYMIANHNTRTMLDVVRAILESPHLTNDDLAIIVTYTSEEGRTAGKKELESFVSIHRMIDILVRRSNNLVADQSSALFPNLYFSGRRNHFSSTLTRLFVLRIVDTDECVYYEELEKLLKGFGHQTKAIEKAANDLLRMQVIFSNNGFLLTDQKEQRTNQTLEKRDLPYGEFMLEDLGVSLRYIQAMAFVTPLKPEYRRIVEVPKKIHTSVASFKLRIRGASALYKQVYADMKDQIQYIKRCREAESSQRAFRYYGFEDTVDDMRASALDGLKAIEASEPAMLKGIIREELFPAYS